MDISKLSILMNQSQLKQQASISVMKKTIDQAEIQSEQMIKMLQQSVQPYLGGSIDVKA
ncbi:YjfB family protein [Amphibacillus sp. MSJ-3]|uniref:YjfB family protein n=1 Tax=Amphibacillus sp. MSJ-3 TaxID=2841505 RepID=UPI001C0F3A12|nr:YjfB family protein [Amphibacillus sp. MSJ-3]MBU5595739.1 YjfB family protein [Amphibacillus sp. MSJ-3]